MIHSHQNHVECNVIFFHGDVYNTLQNPSIREVSILMIYRIPMLQTHCHCWSIVVFICFLIPNKIIGVQISSRIG